MFFIRVNLQALHLLCCSSIHSFQVLSICLILQCIAIQCIIGFSIPDGKSNQCSIQLFWQLYHTGGSYLFCDIPEHPDPSYKYCWVPKSSRSAKFSFFPTTPLPLTLDRNHHQGNSYNWTQCYFQPKISAGFAAAIWLLNSLPLIGCFTSSTWNLFAATKELINSISISTRSLFVLLLLLILLPLHHCS